MGGQTGALWHLGLGGAPAEAPDSPPARLCLGCSCFAPAELASTFPENSGYVAWVTAAFGPFWGFQVRPCRAGRHTGHALQRLLSTCTNKCSLLFPAGGFLEVAEWRDRQQCVSSNVSLLSATSLARAGGRLGPKVRALVMGCMQVAAVAGWVPNTAPPAEQRAETDNAFAPTTCHCGLCGEVMSHRAFVD